MRLIIIFLVGEEFGSMINCDFLMKEILKYFERKPDFNNTMHFTLQGIKEGMFYL